MKTRIIFLLSVIIMSCDISENKKNEIALFLETKQTALFPVDTSNWQAFQQDATSLKGMVKSMKLYRLNTRKKRSNNLKVLNGIPYELQSMTTYFPNKKRRSYTTFNEYTKDTVITKYVYNTRQQLTDIIEEHSDFKMHRKITYNRRHQVASEILFEIKNDTVYRYIEAEKLEYKYINGQIQIHILQTSFGDDTLATKKIGYKKNGYTFQKTNYFDAFETTENFSQYGDVWLSQSEKKTYKDQEDKNLGTTVKQVRDKEGKRIATYYENASGITQDRDTVVYKTNKTYSYPNSYNGIYQYIIEEQNLNGDLITKENVRYEPDSYTVKNGNYTGYRERYEYVYDIKGNWISKQSYKDLVIDRYGTDYNTFSTGNTSGIYEIKDEPILTELREITYYEDTDAIVPFTSSELPEQIQQLQDSIHYWAIAKQKKIDAFNKAVETENFATEITVKTAEKLKSFTPEFWKKKATTYGDLDNDGDEGAAVVYVMPWDRGFGFVHCLGIFKKTTSGNWKLWHQSMAPLLDSKSGGVWGDPFESIKIERNTIVISHFGGSRQKWQYTYRYRFQKDDWYLIGASTIQGDPCEYEEKFDYNTMTGKVITTKIYRDSIRDTSYEDKNWKATFYTEKLPHIMDDFRPGNQKMNIPETEYVMYY